MKIFIEEILKVTGGSLRGCNTYDGICVKNAAIDSRNVEKDGLFIPNITESFDGHDYIESAIQNGAIAMFIDRELSSYDDSKWYILVDDIKEAFFELAKYNRDKYNIPVIGITGSVGKTTAKEMIATVLSEKYNVLRTKGNFNSELGLPIMLLEMDETYDIAVLELGTDHIGEMELLQSMASPTDAVIMNIGVSHLEKFKTRENILKEKSNIFKDIQDEKNILLNADDDMLITLKNSTNAKWFGKDNTADIMVNNFNIDNNVITMNMSTNEETFEVNTPGVSKHLIYPAMAAVYFGFKYGLNIDQIKNGLSKFKTLGKRMDIQKLDNGITIIDDTYNANPFSMKAAIDALELMECSTKIAILGDMFELGDDEVDMHTEIGIYLLNKKIDIVVAIGSNMENMYNEICKDNTKHSYYFKTKEEFYNSMNKIIEKNDTAVLLKASRVMKFEDIIQKIQEI